MSRLAVVPELEKELDHLYELPPAEFTAARNTLARRLKDTGQRALAARIKELRKGLTLGVPLRQLIEEGRM